MLFLGAWGGAGGLCKGGMEQIGGGMGNGGYGRLRGEGRWMDG